MTTIHTCGEVIILRCDMYGQRVATGRATRARIVPPHNQQPTLCS